MSRFILPVNGQVPLDPRTGAFNRPWYLFFQAVFDRIGGADGTGNAVIDAAIDDLRVQVAMLPDSTAALAGLERAFVDFRVAQALIDAAQTAATVALAARVSDLETLGAFA